MKVITSNEDDDNDSSKDNINIISQKTVIIRKIENTKVLTWYFVIKKEFPLLILLDYTFYIT